MFMNVSKRLAALLLAGLLVWLSEFASAQPRPPLPRRELIFASVAELRNTDPHSVFGLHEMIALKQIWEPFLKSTIQGSSNRCSRLGGAYLLTSARGPSRFVAACDSRTVAPLKRKR